MKLFKVKNPTWYRGGFGELRWQNTLGEFVVINPAPGAYQWRLVGVGEISEDAPTEDAACEAAFNSLLSRLMEDLEPATIEDLHAADATACAELTAERLQETP